MGKILVVAEKPSVGRDIARVLKCKEKMEGALGGERFIVSWAIGHLVALYEPEDYEPSLKKWNFSALPIIPEKMKLKAVKNTLPQLKILKKLMNDAETESIICATDSGREGELIFRYIYEITGCKKPVKRLWISSMTDAAILDGFEKLKDSQAYDNLYLSARCRSQADWLVGMNASRAYTLQYDTLLSIGRVQTPTLAMLVDRKNEIDAFEAKDYYEVKALYDDFSGTWFLENEGNTKLFEKEKADAIAKKVKGQEGRLVSVNKEEKRQPPPLLYDLTELQRQCNRKFGFSAQKTLTITQSLYETKKAVTYPRTDSRYLSSDMVGKIKNTLKKLSYVEPYKPYAEHILSLSALPVSKRIIDDSKVTDHHAIIPTDGNIKLAGFSEDEKKVYHTIVLRFLSVFYPNYITSVTKIIAEVEKETFLSKGTTVLSDGWMEIYNKLEEKKDTKTEKEDDQLLPDVKQGDAVQVKDTKVLKKKTKPPQPYTEATLLSAMENAGRFIEDETLKEQMKDSGLGTPATRAAIIERLIAVGYVQRKAKSLLPTDKGCKLIEIVPEELRSAQTTGKWEKGLSSIAKGTMQEERFMGSIKRYVYFLVEQSTKKKQEVVFEREVPKSKSRSSFGKCPLCKKGDILENSKGFYCSQWKRGCSFTIWKNVLASYGGQMDSKIVKTLLKDRKVENFPVMLPQTGEKGLATLVLKEDNSGMVELKNFTRV